MKASSPRFAPDADHDFVIRTVVGLSSEGSAEPGEVFAATSGIRRRDYRGWFTAWDSLARRTKAAADLAASAGHSVSAARAYLRASTYFGVAVNALSALPGSSGLTETFAGQKSAWEAFVALAPVTVERVDIPYGHSTLPGYFFRPARDRPANGATLVAVNGSDGSLAALWATCVSPALARGYNVLVFDGPGQQSQLFENNVPFRPDWEHVLTPVYDFVCSIPGVDASRVTLFGISQGGYWVTRALVFEHRFAAAVVDPGVVDVSASWTRQVPASLLRTLDGGEAERFDREMALGMRLSPSTAHIWRFRARPYSADGYAATIRSVREYRITQEQAVRITTPLLITDPEDEPFWPGQSQQLGDWTPQVSTLVSFTAAEGAGGHCEPLARAVVAQRMFDWMDTVLATRAGRGR
jgi:hypothetical protein